MGKGTQNKSSALPPITRHPLFPVTVALWFGALFALGSLAIRPALIEEALATPPLGNSTRVLLAVAMAGLGGVIGAALARWYVRPKPAPQPRKRKTGVAHADAVDDRDPPAAAPGGSEPAVETFVPTATGRRRNLLAPTSAEAPGPADPYDAAPALDELSPRMGDKVDEIVEIEPHEAGLPRLANYTPGATRETQPSEPSQVEPPGTKNRKLDLFARPHRAQVPSVDWNSEMAGSAPDAAPSSSPACPVIPDAVMPGTGAPDLPDLAPDCTRGTAEQRIASADPDDLSHLELLERLAIAIERKRRAAKAAPENSDRPEDTSVLTLEGILPPPLPAALRPLDLEPDADEDAPVFAPPRHIAIQPDSDDYTGALRSNLTALRKLTRGK